MIRTLADMWNRLHLLKVDIRILGCNLRIAVIQYRLDRLISAKVLEDLKLTTLYLKNLDRR